MNDVMIQFFQFMIAGAGVLAILFFGLNFLTKGFIATFIRVKASQGRLILTRIHAVTDTYYKAGKWEEDFFTFKTRDKETKKIPIKSNEFLEFFSREMGIVVIDIDEQSNKLFNTNFKEVVHFANIDPGRTESLFLRIKNRPILASKKEVIVLLLCVAILATVLFMAFRIIKIEETLQLLGQLSGNI